MQKTTIKTKEQAIAERKWYKIDATDLILGDLAVTAANILRGKNKVDFTPNQDCGDFLIITNTDKVLLSSNKDQKEFWYNHSGYIGGLRKRSGREMIEKYSSELVEIAIKGMIPRNKLGRRIITKAFIYKNEGVDHSAQKPIIVDVKRKGKI